ncbi:MAG: mechanosensitive ion channel [Chitinophagales bacterium]|nr:mechanosensitive ion channel [Bacteroidota bacterium]MCB9043899.1 mechanosensitive ion channel [Chitinophagales bacterium]
MKPFNAFRVIKWIALLVIGLILHNEDLLCQYINDAYIKYVLIFADFLLYYASLRIIEWIFVTIYLRRKKLVRYDNVIVGVDNIVEMLIGVGLIISLLLIWGIKIKELFTSLSIVAAALAIIFKEYISNTINGIIIIFSNNISIEDSVKIGDHRGKIIDMTLSGVSLLNDDDDIIYIPNNIVFNQEITNYTKRETKKTSIEFELETHTLGPFKTLEKQLIDYIKDYHKFMDMHSVHLKIFEIKKDSIKLKFRFSLKEPSRQIEKEIRKKINEKVVDYLHEKYSKKP